MYNYLIFGDYILVKCERDKKWTLKTTLKNLSDIVVYNEK
jgi:hypothetical protein